MKWLPKYHFAYLKMRWRRHSVGLISDDEMFWQIQWFMRKSDAEFLDVLIMLHEEG